MLYASPRDDSGTQARRYEAGSLRLEEVAVVGFDGAGFCWMRAIKPAILSLEDGDGWT